MKPVEVIKGIEMIDLALYLKEERILIIADLHIGIEESLVKQGILIPKFHFRDLVQKVEHIFSVLEENKRPVNTIIINGDLKHEFGTISDEEWRNTIKMIDYLSRKCEKIVLIQGNHDKILGPIADKRKVQLVQSLFIGDKAVIHGDRKEEFPSSVKTIIIGHDHPAASVSEGIRTEKYKCFLTGKYEGKTIIVQPSLNPLTEGTDVTKDLLLSPYLKKELRNFDIYIIADEIYNFGKLKKLYK